MWLKKDEYEHLQDCKRMKDKLEEEVVRLSKLISSEVKDCKIGPWCEDCKHVGYDKSILRHMDMFLCSYVKEVAGEVQYCKKHLHEICPEFELK